MKTLILVFITLLLVEAAHAAKCKYEVEQVDHVESRMLILFRGGLVGLAGYFGEKNGQPYLKGRYASHFKGRAQFTAENPLKLILADGRTLTLDVISDAISSKLRFGHIITASREAQPIFTITAKQWHALVENPIISLSLSFDVEGKRHSTTRDVKDKHAKKIQAALKCVMLAGEIASQPYGAP